jgi:hypothetical protein
MGQPCYMLKVYFPIRRVGDLFDRCADLVYPPGQSFRGECAGDDPAGGSAGGHPDGEVTTEYNDYKVIPGGYVFPLYDHAQPVWGEGPDRENPEVNGYVDAEGRAE